MLLKHLVTFRKIGYEQINFAEVVFNGELCSQITKDQGGEDIKETYHLAKEKVALQATADGSCFYNAISIALLGDESLALELRIACCTKMLLNKQRYIYHPLAD